MLNQQAVRRLYQANGISDAPMHELCLYERSPMNTKHLSMTSGLLAAITASVWLLSENVAVDSRDRSDQDAAVSDFQVESSSSGSVPTPAERKTLVVYGQQQFPAPDMPSDPKFDYRELLPEDIEDQVAQYQRKILPSIFGILPINEPHTSIASAYIKDGISGPLRGPLDSN